MIFKSETVFCKFEWTVFPNLLLVLPRHLDPIQVQVLQVFCQTSRIDLWDLNDFDITKADASELTLFYDDDASIPTLQHYPSTSYHISGLSTSFVKKRRLIDAVSCLLL